MPQSLVEKLTRRGSQELRDEVPVEVYTKRGPIFGTAWRAPKRDGGRGCEELRACVIWVVARVGCGLSTNASWFHLVALLG